MNDQRRTSGAQTTPILSCFKVKSWTSDLLRCPVILAKKPSVSLKFNLGLLIKRRQLSMKARKSRAIISSLRVGKKELPAGMEKGLLSYPAMLTPSELRKNH
jgi:hypothetical protein